jgi:hypothetical protein
LSAQDCRQRGLPMVEAPIYTEDGISVTYADVRDCYDLWPSPVVIVSDGPYGLGLFPGDPPTEDRLADWYEPHIEVWSNKATALTTLWFWNSELGWANVHPVLQKHGWRYRCCNIWDKGIAHVAGNCNTQRLRKLPVVTEVCVQYVKEPVFRADGRTMTMQEWLRYEWERSGVPLYKANEACGVANAATRKYLTQCHLWYFPPPDSFERMAQYLQEHGRPSGRPYMSIDGGRPMTAGEWANMRAKFDCEAGVTNVWPHPPIHGEERVKSEDGYLHANQKPLELVELTIRLSSDPGDVVWEPFGGLCTAAVASRKLRRKCFAAERIPDFYQAAIRRLEEHDVN